MLTIAYMTCRRNPLIEMFLDSFHRECGGDYTDMKIVVVDFYADEPGRKEEFAKKAHCPITHVPPKPCVWQGPHRLTKKDYFAASNARNTAVCYAPDGWIAFVDDLSVLCPGWLGEVKRMVSIEVIACGAYEKVRDLKVEHGEIVGYTSTELGTDGRLKNVKSREPVKCNGGWMFGSSCSIPVEALLKINGWDEDCDSLSGEDYICGHMLQQHGYRFRYCPRMKTLESEDGHYGDTSFARFDKGVSPNDKSHAILNRVKRGRSMAPNYFGDGGLRALRQRILSGMTFPIPSEPQHDWYDGQSLSEL